MGGRWLEGVWLGKRFNSGENVVMMRERGDVVRARSVQEMPIELTMELLDGVKGQPWQPTATSCRRDGPREEGRQPAQVKETHEGEEPIPRSMQITRSVLERVGYTPGCQKCRLTERGDGSKTTLGHSRACRERVEAAVKEHEQLKERLERAQKRKGLAPEEDPEE